MLLISLLRFNRCYRVQCDVFASKGRPLGIHCFLDLFDIESEQGTILIGQLEDKPTFTHNIEQCDLVMRLLGLGDKINWHLFITLLLPHEDLNLDRRKVRCATVTLWGIPKLKTKIREKSLQM